MHITLKAGEWVTISFPSGEEINVEVTGESQFPPEHEATVTHEGKIVYSDKLTSLKEGIQRLLRCGYSSVMAYKTLKEQFNVPEYHKFCKMYHNK